MMMTSSGLQQTPGTVLLVDKDGTSGLQHAKGSDEAIILIPTPSDDPDDPLNWSWARKHLQLACICAYCVAIGIASAAIYSILVPISAATGLTVDTLVTSTGYMFLTLGWGCLFWQPIAQKYGKRPVYLISILGTLGMMIWAPYATTSGTWIASKLVQGFFGAPIESLCEISISDVWFTHERGTYIGYYALFLVGSNFLAPILAGFINDGQGWPWVLHWCAFFCAGSFVICFFCLEETNYVRATMDGRIQGPATSPDSTASENGQEGQDLEKAVERVRSRSQSETATSQSTRLSYWSKLKFFRPGDIKRTNVSLRHGVIRPFYYFTFPGVVFAGIMYGAAICWFNLLNGTTSVILSSEPYGWRSSMVGLSYVACLIGVSIGFILAGPFGDRFVIWKSRRHQGIMEPEYRLWLFGVLAVTTSGGLILWGVGAAHGVHWIGLCFGMAIFALILSAGASLSVGYVIDCYKELGANAIVTVMLIRNTMSFAFSYGVTPWVNNMGLQNAFILAGLVALAQTGLFLPMIKWGKSCRERTAEVYRRHAAEEGTH